MKDSDILELIDELLSINEDAYSDNVDISAEEDQWRRFSTPSMSLTVGEVKELLTDADIISREVYDYVLNIQPIFTNDEFFDIKTTEESLGELIGHYQEALDEDND